MILAPLPETREKGLRTGMPQATHPDEKDQLVKRTVVESNSSMKTKSKRP